MKMTALLILTVIAFQVAVVASDTPATAYTNHTVGGSAGWSFDGKNNISATNYSSWAASQTFNLGDYLIFNTITNQTVIQTYNKTTFNSCTTDDALDNDTFQYNGGSNEFDQKLTIAVPLTTMGSNYYFSDAEDGVQCQRGMAFEISVNRGRGLPPSLNQPPPPPYIEPPGPDTAQPSPVNINGGSPEIVNGASTSVANVRFLLIPLLIGVASLLVF